MYFPKRHTCNACHFFYIPPMKTHEGATSVSFLLFLPSLSTDCYHTHGCLGDKEAQTAETTRTIPHTRSHADQQNSHSHAHYRTDDEIQYFR